LSEKKQSNPNRRSILLSGTALVAATVATDAFAQAQKAAPASPAPVASPSGRRPNILVIFGDDIGQNGGQLAAILNAALAN